MIRINLLAIVLSLTLPYFAYSQNADWDITLDATILGNMDKGKLILGANSLSEDGFDVSDIPQPPAFPTKFLEITTQHSQNEERWEDQPKGDLDYQSEIRAPLLPQNTRIPFSLKTDQSGDVNISWNAVNQPSLEDYAVILRDVGAGSSLDMRSQSFYNKSVSNGNYQFELELNYQAEATPTPTLEPTVTPTPTPPCTANFDIAGNDGIIDLNDILVMTKMVNQGEGGDFNCDGVTNYLDLWLLSLHWQNQ